MKEIPDATLAASSSPPMTREPRWLDGDDGSPARTPLTRRRIVESALAIVHERGLAGLTMRRLAATLDVAPMSLYSHVADKSELTDLMTDHVLGDVKARLSDEGSWQDQLRDIACCFRDAWQEHPGFVIVYSTGVTLGPNSIVVVERMVKVLRDAGFSDRDAGYALYTFIEYVVGTLQFSPIRTAPGAEPAADGQFHDRVSEYFVAVPIDTIPNIVAVDEFLNGDSFGFGLDLIIAGLEARLTQTALPET